MALPTCNPNNKSGAVLGILDMLKTVASQIWVIQSTSGETKTAQDAFLSQVCEKVILNLSNSCTALENALRFQIEDSIVVEKSSSASDVTLTSIASETHPEEPRTPSRPPVSLPFGLPTPPPSLSARAASRPPIRGPYPPRRSESPLPQRGRPLRREDAFYDELPIRRGRPLKREGAVIFRRSDFSRHAQIVASTSAAYSSNGFNDLPTSSGALSGGDVGSPASSPYGRRNRPHSYSFGASHFDPNFQPGQTRSAESADVSMSLPILEELAMVIDQDEELKHNDDRGVVVLSSALGLLPTSSPDASSNLASTLVVPKVSSATTPAITHNTRKRSREDVNDEEYEGRRTPRRSRSADQMPPPPLPFRFGRRGQPSNTIQPSRSGGSILASLSSAHFLGTRRSQRLGRPVQKGRGDFRKN
ncbi:hypothetical protein BDZ97DRAFT_1929469 [Flammula alnicola]|nr:hypothetical protein BDZ97DRAFT_1929469 [Flammula alnicola]